MYTPFSQRNGYEQVPPQLKLGDVSFEQRKLIDYYVSLEIERESIGGVDHSYLRQNWKRVASDIHVIVFGKEAATFENNSLALRRSYESFAARAQFEQLFDLVEFLVRHERVSDQLKRDLAGCFVQTRSAYRIIDEQIVAIGTAQQGAAFEAALDAVETKGADAARSHLIAAGTELRDGNWPDSVRESIHAVEAVALLLEPGASTLGDALRKLERKGNLHGSLKKAFGSLYGYTSDEEGIRHAKVFEETAKVDEADALFMLGACASFVSYLIARDTKD